MRSALAAGLAFVLIGCAAPRELPVFQPDASENATIRWRRAGVSITCDAVCARSAEGGALLRLYKQSPAPLLTLRLDPDGLLSAGGSLTGRGWQGKYSEVPRPLATWVSFLMVYQREKNLPVGAKELHTAGERVAYRKTKAGLETLSVLNTDTGETVSGLFKNQ